ncbi:MAG: hypothetical protein ACK52Z_05385 [Acidobacteriota bacterium]|jgi:hypothetical protein
MDRQIDETFAALLDRQWLLDLDATVKTLCCWQEEACVGYSRVPEWRSSSLGESPTSGVIGMTG